MRNSIGLVLGIVLTLVAATVTAWPGPDGGGSPQPNVEPGEQGRPQPAKSLDLQDFQPLIDQVHPGTKTSSIRGASRMYGRAFSHGATAQASVDAFIQNTMPLFGITPGELEARAAFLPENHPGNTVPLMYDAATGTYKFTAFYYTQVRNDIDVFRAQLCLVVRNEPGFPLVLASSDLRDVSGFNVPDAKNLALNTGQAFAQARRLVGNNAQMSQPSKFLWAGVEEMAVMPRVAMQFYAEAIDAGAGLPRAELIIADAQTGQILHHENVIHDVDVTGNVAGMSTAGWGADDCAPEVLMPMPYARVGIGATLSFADVNGNFTIPNAGSTDVTVDAAVRGQFFVVNNTTTPGGGNSLLSQVVTPPGPANFIFNELNDSQYKRAEVNAYIHSNIVRDFVLAQNPAFPTIATEVNFPVNVNINSTCNAFYSSANQTINFYVQGGADPCNNTAFSNVVHHEYGHRVVNAAGSGQGAYGEGSGDTIGNLISDIACTGDGFRVCGTCLRDPMNPICLYQTTGCSSCGSAIHSCGKLIAGAMYSTRNAMAAAFPATYRQIINPLYINSMLVHGTGTGITPQITIDLLTLDDNDANIFNGTPHYPQINQGFTTHNMAAPALLVGIMATPATNASFSGLAGGPFTPAGANYVVENLEDFPLDYSVTANQPWIDLTNASGTLPPNSTIMVTASMSANANSMSNGIYSGLLTFTNLTNGDGNTTRTVGLEIGRIVYPATGVPTAIPDNNATGITSTINIPDSYCVGDVDVQVNVQHLSIGQIIVELVNPQGTVVRLHNRTGGTADHIVKTYSDGTVNPDGPGVLANFNGYVVGGNWQLKVSDNASATTGTLNSWSLRIVPSGTVCPPIATPQTLTVPVVVTSPITLAGQSSNGPVLSYTIMSMPAHATLLDPNGGTIVAAPYTLLSGGNVVNFMPDPIYAGSDSFAFKVADFLLESTNATIGVTIGSPQLAHNYNMDVNPGWTTTGPAINGWAWGVPCGCGTTTGRLDPSSGFTGANVYGYNLGGYYTNSMPEYFLTTTAINCSNLSGTQLRFQRWLGIESATFDHAKVQVSNNGTTWTTVFDHVGGSVNPTSWTAVNYNIAAVADGQTNVYVRWSMGVTDTSVVYQGWNIDDVQIWGIRPPCLPDVNGNGAVNVDDLLAVVNSWGPCPGCPADVAPPGGDGYVNVDDLLAVINGWGLCP